MQGSLPAGWLAFTGRELNPLDRDEGFQITSSSSLPGLFLAQHPQTFTTAAIRKSDGIDGKRKVIVVIRERGGNSVPAVLNTESQAAPFIRGRISKGTVVHADEVASWDNLHERFEAKRLNHQEAYNLDGACTNMAEEYLSRLRRAEIGIHHHIRRVSPALCAGESSWREVTAAFPTGIR